MIIFPLTHYCGHPHSQPLPSFSPSNHIQFSLPSPASLWLLFVPTSTVVAFPFRYKPPSPPLPSASSLFSLARVTVTFIPTLTQDLLLQCHCGLSCSPILPWPLFLPIITMAFLLPYHHRSVAPTSPSPWPSLLTIERGSLPPHHCGFPPVPLSL